ncbi:MAG TPA: PEP/pyruvate-binding domain-containing protein [Candidatus Krumholzibacteria bacterium]|nr:PEP/pyruvate-binding domain-containing protein [Candidatus Krumholzibacteria bacterium]
MSVGGFGKQELAAFDRAFFDPRQRFTRIGDGELGGKARGLLFAADLLARESQLLMDPNVVVDVPASTVITTDLFDRFMQANGLYDVALSDSADDRIAHAFQKGDLPVELVGDLRALVEQVTTPLAVRSSSLLEDALFRPFAGVYQTKMIPNNQSDAGDRFTKLVEALKFVYASMFARGAKNYLQASGKTPRDEKMAVVIQEVIGTRHDSRFYPDVSGVAKSFNFYPTGNARPEEGVVHLALGLGKTIVDGGVSWTHSPAHPRAPAPFASVRDMLDHSQLEFWVVHMGKPAAFDPIAETEYLAKHDLGAAEYDGTLRYTCSTYDAAADRIVPGTGTRGARILNFAPMLDLEEIALNPVIRALLDLFARELASPVEIEFAVALGPGPRARLGFLQVRPMVVSEDVVQLDESELQQPGLLLFSDNVMGNGSSDSIQDIVFVKPKTFDKGRTRQIAGEVEQFNRTLLDAGTPYLLLGFGRWGSADPFLGIPVEWGQICGASAIVESTLPEMNVDPSQGSHFFHNMSSFRVSYFAMHHAQRDIDWEWLERQEQVGETEHVRHVRAPKPLRLKVDGRSRRGAIWYAPANS